MAKTIALCSVLSKCLLGYTSTEWRSVDSYDWNLDESTLMTRLEKFSTDVRSNVHVHHTDGPSADEFEDGDSNSGDLSSKPRVKKGYRAFKWVVDDALAKVGYGGRFDALVHTEFHKKPFWTDYDTY
mmetsp:Transcript_11481/g.15490  ORF Transcript_11481/g.15490 Transcript_11481/m.15490 type:complete len:127 (+) Transcript_11481:51-431(+)|eukprot:CAMPEP_0185570914 /NCGR_PEP_ID=MMETSP0434-20130131/3044_1 /TAXON_ID=626734 ORGANISM="Favella taraikaensis, Strain Fe Narragansett Bay" /NCGR_SAMPLE_ID=MMETSP0434 /ASSEMBLY_ACC=CAM_ASM_000379 /LENGTH=126 /DNA_ID=CAMNT_0028186139 /DNA_START=21 /DNA_END=401 /DNA_ORIENTATION=+